MLLEKDGKPTQNYHVLRKYREQMEEADSVILKVPQIIFARTLRRGGAFVENEAYLDTGIFTDQFYKPALEILGPTLSGFIFEQVRLSMVLEKGQKTLNRGKCTF